MGGLSGILESLPAAEPTWSFPEPAAPDRAAAVRLLASLDATDRRTLLLSHGFGLPLGDVAWALGLDASVVSWRLRRALSGTGISPAALERGLAAVLGEGVARARGGAALPVDLPDAALERLRTRLQGVAPEHAGARGALGVGSLLLIVAAVAGFLVYGVIRDSNPLWRGRDLARRGDYAGARQSFLELGPLGEARAWIGVCWLAEGQFDRAIEVLSEPEASQFLGAFRPMEKPLEALAADIESPALLPRGLILASRPMFVFRGAPAGVLRLEVTPTALGGAPTRRETWPVPDTSGGPRFVVFDFPSEARALQAGTAVWTAPGGEDRPSSFTLLARESQMDLRVALERHLTHEIPRPAQDFLRGQFFLRHGLYQNAGEQFARLARQFPDQPWPRRAIEQVAAALGVDPGAILR